jgi:hypothetical protein
MFTIATTMAKVIVVQKKEIDMRAPVLVSLACAMFCTSTVQANLMSVDVGSVMYTDPRAPSGGLFRFTYQYDDAVGAVTTTRSALNSLAFSQIALGPSYGRFSDQGGVGSFTGSLVSYQFGLNLIGTQAASIVGPGFVNTPSSVPTGLSNTLTLNFLQGVATYNLNGVQASSNYGCVFTRFQGAINIQNQFGNTVEARLGSEGNFLGGSGNRVMCLDGYAYNPDTASQSILSESSSRIAVSTELLRFAPSFNPDLRWFASGGTLVSPFSASTPVGNGTVPLPGSLGLALFGVCALGSRKLRTALKRRLHSLH